MDIEQLRAICLQLPGVTEDIKWEHDLVFSVGDKMFCAASLEPPLRCSFKVRDEEFEELTQQPAFIPAPYLARAKWVQVATPMQLRGERWEALIKTSYQLVASKLSKKKKADLGISDVS
jgi:predicted DNA-binding protein (MmcQ/YjbR family)